MKFCGQYISVHIQTHQRKKKNTFTPNGDKVIGICLPIKGKAYSIIGRGSS
jgi:hypothetical protein